MRKLTERDIERARNDSGLAPKEVIAALTDAVEIKYGRLTIAVQRHAVERARLRVAAMAPGERQLVLASVNRELARNVPKVLAGRVKKNLADDTADDLVLWHALKND